MLRNPIFLCRLRTRQREEGKKSTIVKTFSFDEMNRVDSSGASGRCAPIWFRPLCIFISKSLRLRWTIFLCFFSLPTNNWIKISTPAMSWVYRTEKNALNSIFLAWQPRCNLYWLEIIIAFDDFQCWMEKWHRQCGQRAMKRWDRSHSAQICLQHK